jgi:hypothetical protein
MKLRFITGEYRDENIGWQKRACVPHFLNEQARTHGKHFPESASLFDTDGALTVQRFIHDSAGRRLVAD